MKLRAAALSIVATIAATPAMAQYWYAPGPYGGARPYYAPAPYGYEGVSPYEIAAIVRSANLQPISRPWRNGANFMVRATNARGEVVNVLVDAYRGRILRIAAAEMAPVARLAPDPRDTGMAPQYDADGNPLPPRPVPQAAPHAQRPAAEHNRTAAVTPAYPPLPRPRPADAPSPVVAVKPAPDAPAVAPTATPPAPATETVPQPTETPAGANGTAGATPTGPGAGSAFPPVTPLE